MQGENGRSPVGVGIGVRALAVRWLPPLLLAAGGLYFVLRGPVRALAGMDGRDLTVFYTATRAWLAGRDPYDRAVLGDLARSAGISIEPSRSLNPPLAFPLLAPWAALPWDLAWPAWVAIEVALVSACLAAALALARLRPAEPRGWLLLAFGLSLAPFHTAISEGQLSIAVAALVLAAVLALERDRPVPAGIAVALAVALKPQMGLLFIAVLAVRGERRALVAAGVALATIAAVGAARLWLAGIDWSTTLVAALASSGFADPTNASTQRLNAQALFNVLVPRASGLLVEGMTLGLGLAVGLVVALALRGRRDHEATLLAWSAGAVMTLLIVYNRSYDAVLLLLPLAWVFTRSRAPAPTIVVGAVVVACAVFFVPGAAAMADLRLPENLRWVGGTPWWGLLRVHQVLALLVVLTGITIAAIRLPVRDAVTARVSRPPRLGTTGTPRVPLHASAPHLDTPDSSEPDRTAVPPVRSPAPR